MSWLKPYLRTWYAVYPDSVPPAGQIAHAIKKLLKAHPEERILSELAAYLKRTKPDYLNIPKFVMAFGSWNRPEQRPPAERRPYSQTADQADRAAGIPIL